MDRCKKCGKLAVKDLCTKTAQGDMTILEYYIPGTEPFDCYKAITLCRESEKIPGKYFLNSAKETIVYLKAATNGTEDVMYVLPKIGEIVCDVHTKLWDTIIPSEKTQETEQKENQKEEQNDEKKEEPEDKGWLGNLIDNIFDNQ